jgi:hypothetical protein
VKTDTSERGLERLICTALTGTPCEPGPPGGRTEETAAAYGGLGWICGDPSDYDREHAVDLAQLSTFLRDTQPEGAEALDLGQDSPTRRKFLARLQGEIARRGVIDVLRHGLKHGPHHIDLFYGTPSPENPTAQERYRQNRFSVSRQLRHSRDESRLALDLCLFINGLPVFTLELKNSLTKQTVADAVEQYMRDRDPRELLFQFPRCAAHLAVDDQEVRFCTHLKGKASWFLPFNQGWNDGAGKRYLVQHSAGSGKSNSIAWLAHQLIGLAKDGAPVFDSIIVVTDRRIPRLCLATRSSTSSGRGRSSAATSRVTTTPSASRPRSWWITSTSRCWRWARWAGGLGPWWLPPASSAPSSTTTPSATTWPSARARTRPSWRSPASTSTAA